MTPKRTSRAARLLGKEQIPVIGLILSATEWQLVIFPFAKNCINGVVSKKQKLVSEGPIFGMLSPQLWCLLVAYCRSFPHMKTHLSAEDLTAGQTLCRRKTYSSLITTPALEHEKELIQAKKAEEKPRKKQRKLRKQRKRQRKLRKQRKRQRKLRKQRKRQRKLRKQRKRQRKLRKQRERQRKLRKLQTKKAKEAEEIIKKYKAKSQRYKKRFKEVESGKQGQ